MYLPPHVSFAGELRGAPVGRAAVFQTLRIMRDMVGAARVDPAIINAAHTLVFLTPERDQLAEVSAVFNWVRDSVRYVPDVLGVETLAAPALTMQRRTGDCDDQTALLCALLESIGFPTRFVVARYEADDFEHVYCQVFANGRWLDLDPINRNFTIGESHTGAIELHIEAI